MKSINKPNLEHYYIDINGKVYNSKKNFKEVKAHPIPQGYMLIVLKASNIKPKGYYIHRLVCEVYISNPNNYPEVNHKNKIRDDNRIENLEWCTKKQNSNHKYLDYESKIDMIYSNKKLLQDGIDLYNKTFNSKELCKLWNCSKPKVLKILKDNNIEIKRSGFKIGPNKNKPYNIFKSYIPKYWFLTDNGYNFSL
jgi:hypothetical protein